MHAFVNVLVYFNGVCGYTSAIKGFLLDMLLLLMITTFTMRRYSYIKNIRAGRLFVI
jgi:hypothetical protein